MLSENVNIAIYMIEFLTCYHHRVLSTFHLGPVAVTGGSSGGVDGTHLRLVPCGLCSHAQFL